MSEASTRRPYRLSPQGLIRLRESACRVKPWLKSTGPKSEAGRARSKMNALKDGRHRAEMRAWRRDAMRFITLDRLLRDGLLGRTEVDDPAAAVNELARLARRLSESAPQPG